MNIFCYSYHTSHLFFLSALNNALGSEILQVFDLSSIKDASNDVKTQMQERVLLNEFQAGGAGQHIQFKSQCISYPNKTNMANQNIDDVINTVHKLSGRDGEGLVIYIDGIPKVKIKSPDYLKIHSMMNNNIFTIKDAVSIIANFEEAEYIAIIPDNAPLLEPFVEARNNLRDTVYALYFATLTFLKNNVQLNIDLLGSASHYQ